jgi:hypothetical protein
LNEGRKNTYCSRYVPQQLNGCISVLGSYLFKEPTEESAVSYVLERGRKIVYVIADSILRLSA